MPVLNIPIAKAGKGVTLAVEFDEFDSLSPEDKIEVVRRGMKDVLNSRMPKAVLAPSKLIGEELEANKARALAQAEKNLRDLKAGKLREKTAKDSTHPREVVTKAMQMAKDIAKNLARAKGIKPLSAVPATQWTAFAKALLERQPEIYEQAKVALEASKTASTAPADLDLASFIQVDPSKVKARKTSTKAEGQLSATQAGKPATRGRVPSSRSPTQEQPHHRATH